MPFKKGYTPHNKGVKLPETPIEPRLFNHRKITSAGCWEFTGSKDSGGYGHVRFKGKLRKVHRVSAYLYNGFDLEDTLKVLHKCDNVACFNPDHLFMGTQADNMSDMVKKGRQPDRRGNNNGRAKLTSSQVTEIRRMKTSGSLEVEIMTRFNISRATVWRICSNTSWTNVQ